MDTLLSLALLLSAAAPGQQDALHFHVAAHGDDRNPGSRDKPFATPQRARDAIRELKKQQGLKQVVVVHLAGNHTLREPLVLTPEDSGTQARPIIWRGGQVSPVLSGGRRLSGWKEAQVQGKTLWVLDLPEVKAGKWYFHQLWIDGQRRPRARHPNVGFLKVASVPDATPRMPYNVGQKRFQYAPGDLRAMNNLEDVDVVLLHLWVSVRLAVESLEEKERIVNFKVKSRRKLTDGPDPARYHVENALELLDEPGEWYLDRKTGRLHYWPLPGEKLERIVAVAPVLPRLLHLQGKPEARQYLEHVRFEGLTFAEAEWWPGRDDPVDVQAAATVPAVIQGDGVRHVEFVDCEVTRASGYGIHLAQGCQHCRITRCLLHDLGAGGIRLGETTIRDDPARQSHHLRVTHCRLRQLGRVFPQAVGLWIGQSFGNTLASNDILDLYYTGISVGWTWGYGRSLARDNVIENNRVSKVGQGRLSDMGGIYTLGIQPGTIIRNNIFADISAHRYGGWGIYFDEGSTSIVAERNLVFDTTHGGFHQHYGKENVVRHNIFALGRDAQIRRTRQENHLSFTFENNVVVWERGNLLDGRWDDLKVAFKGNVYWHLKKEPIRFGKWTWEQWRDKGMDGNGLIADPLFADVGQRDFRPRKESPLLKRIQLIDLAKVGPSARE